MNLHLNIINMIIQGDVYVNDSQNSKNLETNFMQSKIWLSKAMEITLSIAQDKRQLKIIFSVKILIVHDCFQLCLLANKFWCGFRLF